MDQSGVLREDFHAKLRLRLCKSCSTDKASSFDQSFDRSIAHRYIPKVPLCTLSYPGNPICTSLRSDKPNYLLLALLLPSLLFPLSSFFNPFTHSIIDPPTPVLTPLTSRSDGVRTLLIFGWHVRQSADVRGIDPTHQGHGFLCFAYICAWLNQEAGHCACDRHRVASTLHETGASLTDNAHPHQHGLSYKPLFS